MAVLFHVMPDFGFSDHLPFVFQLESVLGFYPLGQISGYC